MSAIRILIASEETGKPAQWVGRLKSLGYEIAGSLGLSDTALVLPPDVQADVFFVVMRVSIDQNLLALIESLHSRFQLPVVVVASPESDASPMPEFGHGYVCMTEPITDREVKLAIQSLMECRQNQRRQSTFEARLNQSENQWQRTFDAITDAVCIVDLEARIQRVNQAFCALAGLTREQLIGSCCCQTIHGIKESCVSGPLGRMKATRHRELVIVQSNDRWLEILADPLLDPEGRLEGAVHIVTDITARKLAEDALRKQADLMDQVQDAIGVSDLNGRIRFWNRGSEQLYGWDRLDVVGKIAPNILYKAIPQERQDAMKGLMQDGQWRGELEQITRSGKIVVVDSRWKLIRNADGSPDSILFVNTDITDKKAMESQFLRAQRIQNLGQLAAGIAHDMNNILAPILMAAPMLREMATDDEAVSLLGTIESCAQRGADVVRQLQTFGKEIEGRRVPVQLRYLTRDVLRIVLEAFPKSITVESYIPDDLWMVPGDAMQLHQLLMNLCVNARDAMPQGGTLKLTLEAVQLDEQFIQATPDAKTGPYVLVTVSDTGTGITTENLDLIFDPFFTTKESGQGSGLGLSTALGIVRRHGGFIQVDSQPGHGSRFKVYLPAEPGPAAERRDSRPTEDLQGRGEIILVVDDEEEVRKVTKATLEKNGYQVLTAGDGTEALAVYAQNQKDVKAVITDLMMPFMDGPATIHALRKLNPDLPILAASGRGAMAKISDLEALHVPKVLAKPFTGETLLRAMRNLLRPETR